MDVEVEVQLNPPRKLKKAKRSYFLSAQGEAEIQLPANLTELVMEEFPDGEVVTAVRIPQWLAVDRGLSQPEESAADDSMSRDDWFLLGITMALLIRGESVQDCVWEARKISAKLRA